jgi:hypothetical protein
MMNPQVTQVDPEVPEPDQEHQQPTEEKALWIDWVPVAQHNYGFDLPTARRLAFARWLYVTGRLTDG